MNQHKLVWELGSKRRRVVTHPTASVPFYTNFRQLGRDATGVYMLFAPMA